MNMQLFTLPPYRISPGRYLVDSDVSAGYRSLQRSPGSPHCVGIQGMRPERCVQICRAVQSRWKDGLSRSLMHIADQVFSEAVSVKRECLFEGQ